DTVLIVVVQRTVGGDIQELDIHGGVALDAAGSSLIYLLEVSRIQSDTGSAGSLVSHILDLAVGDADIHGTGGAGQGGVIVVAGAVGSKGNHQGAGAIVTDAAAGSKVDAAQSILVKGGRVVELLVAHSVLLSTVGVVHLAHSAG